MINKEIMNSENLNKNKDILIKKASGLEEKFSPDKLERSLINAGALEDTIQKIVKDVESWIYPGVTTKKIYSHAFSMLRRDRAPKSIRYKLKQAIFQLGPTGYPFETLVGQIFKQRGFETEVGIIVDGKCVTHEMDVIATQAGIQNLVECKYHSDQGKLVSVQVPLYVRSRVDDIIHKRQELPEYNGFTFSGWVITNTRFSSESIQYGKCSGLNLMAWDYPYGNGLKDIIEKLKIYPITILHNLTVKEKQYLLDQSMVICSSLLENIDALNVLNINKKREKALLKELNDICQ